jgi:hypothetical protein
LVRPGTQSNRSETEATAGRRKNKRRWGDFFIGLEQNEGELLARSGIFGKIFFCLFQG